MVAFSAHYTIVGRTGKTILGCALEPAVCRPRLGVMARFHALSSSGKRKQIVL